MYPLFRPASPSDAPELQRLNIAFNGPPGQTLEDTEAALAMSGSEKVFVAQMDASNVLGGFCCCQVKYSFCYSRPSVEVTEFFVDPPCRRQGLGRGLMGQVSALCQKLGAEELTLLTGGDNVTAQAFYKSLGFAPSGELHMCSER